MEFFDVAQKLFHLIRFGFPTEVLHIERAIRPSVDQDVVAAVAAVSLVTESTR